MSQGFYCFSFESPSHFIFTALPGREQKEQADRAAKLSRSQTLKSFSSLPK
ncbi:unnamed protein product [Scytosiphon promiscuus]